MKVSLTERSSRCSVVASTFMTVALTLAACSGAAPATPATATTQIPSTAPTSPTPPMRPRPEASNVPSTSTNATDSILTKIPEAARPKTKAGAEAFSRFFFEQLARGMGAPDETVIDGLYAPECDTCKNFRARIDRAVKAGNRYVPATIVVTSVDAFDYGDQVRVNVSTDQPSVNVLDKKGNAIRRTPAAKETFVAELEYSGTWKVTGVGAYK